MKTFKLENEPKIETGFKNINKGDKNIPKSAKYEVAIKKW